MYNFNPITQRILDRYHTHLELIDTVPIGFTGVANEKPANVYSNEVDADSLLFAFNVDFTNTAVQVWIRSLSPQYDWMANVQANPAFTPIGAIAGISSQVMPVLPLVMPFFLKANGKLEFRFINAATSPITGGNVTLRRLKLVNPINGGWNPDAQ
jgi:hypothetical protein